MVLDIFSGSNTTGQAAEGLGRKWIAMEERRDYAALSALRFIPDWPTQRIREIIHVMESGQSFDFAADTGSEVLPLLATQDVMVPLVDPESFQPATELPLFAHHSGQTR